MTLFGVLAYDVTLQPGLALANEMTCRAAMDRQVDCRIGLGLKGR